MQNCKSKTILNLLNARRWRKKLRRKYVIKHRPSDKSGYYKIYQYQTKVDEATIKRAGFPPILEFLHKVDFLQEAQRKASPINIISDFTFESNYAGCIKQIQDIALSMAYAGGQKFILNFEKCQKVDQAAVFVLRIVTLDILEHFLKLNRNLSIIDFQVDFEVYKSSEETVNRILYINGFHLPNLAFTAKGMMPRRGTGYIKGSKSQKHYSENRKGAIVTKIRRFLNDCLTDHGWEFNPQGENDMDGLLSEILGNGEDHSPFDTYYSTANSFIEAPLDGSGEVVGEVNLCVMNFGYSIFEGLEANKDKNIDNYSLLDGFYKNLLSNHKDLNFTKENLFTLYALQEGVSRLKFEDQSRGNGSMKFISSFFGLGDFEDPTKKYHPELSIISGSTQVRCTNKYKPFPKDEIITLSLNSEMDLDYPPDRSNLISLKNPFPGTILTVRIYLNSGHLSKKYTEG